MAESRVGTSGWHYQHWKKILYPSDSKTEDWLRFYARRFDTVEINNSFYHLPSRATFSSWAEKTPPGFMFAVKASRYITHMKKLKSPREPLSSLLENAAGLGKKLGPVLFQLPPRWKRNPARLQEFVDILPREKRFVFEFRDETWLHDDIYRILEAGNCALCAASSPSFPGIRRATADFAFMRFHGAEVDYSSRYARETLEEWAEYARSLLRDGRDVYAYFNNDALGYAVEDATSFRQLLGS